jgi:hypothetical protein
MSARSEYTNSTVSSNNCSYNSLGRYSGAKTTMATVKAGSTQGFYLTPNYSSIGYNSLTHVDDSNGSQSYPTISQAYGDGSCNTTYTKRSCGGASMEK